MATPSVLPTGRGPVRTPLRPAPFPDPENAHGARPVLGIQADPVENQIALGPGQHPARRVVVVQPVEGDQGHPRRFRRLGGWGLRQLAGHSAVVVLDRIVDDLIEQLGGSTSRSFSRSNDPRRASPRNRLRRSVRAKAGSWRPLASGASRPSARYRCVFFASSSISLSRSGRRAMNWRESRCTDIDLVELGSRRLHDAEALQEDHGVVAELAVRPYR